MNEVDRKRGFKNTFDPAMGRSKRTMVTLQIRKVKKEEQHRKHRERLAESSAHNFYPLDVETLHGASLLKWIVTARKNMEANLSILQQHVQATSFIESLVSINDPPIEDIVRCNILVVLVGLCEICKSDPYGQHAIQVAETCLNIFTRIAEAGQLHHIDSVNVIHNLSPFGLHPNEEVRRKALSLLLELAEQDIHCQRKILGNPDALDSIFENLDSPADASLLHQNISLIAYLSSATDTFPRFHKAIVRLGDVIHRNLTFKHMEISTRTIQKTLEALFHLSQSYEGMQTMLSIEIVPKLVELLDYRYNIAGESLKIFGNFSSSTNAQLQALVIESGAFAKFGKLVDAKMPRLARSICFILSNIAAGTDAQRALLLNEETGLLPKILDVGRRNFRTWEEVVQLLANLCNMGKKYHVEATARYGAEEKFVEYLRISGGNPALFCQVVKALERMFHLEIIRDVGSLRDTLDRLVYHQCNQVSEMVDHLLTKIQKEDDEMENRVPDVDFNGEFSSGKKKASPRKLFTSPIRRHGHQTPPKPFGLRGLGTPNK